MTSASMRRLPMRMMEPSSQPQDENAVPAALFGRQAAAVAASPTRIAKSAHARSPSKMPTLSDIAARLNLDKDAATPTTSPAKQMLASLAEAARPRLELTGRITGSPKPAQTAERKSPLLPASPTKVQADAVKCLSGPSSGACSPTKRMLANGLPSLEEIRDRMSRKGLSTSGEAGSPNLPSAPSSPSKLASTDALASSNMIEVTEPKPVLSAASAATTQLAKTASGAGPSAKPKPKLALKVTMPVGAPAASSTAPAASSSKPGKYPLEHEWTLFFDTRAGGASTPGFGPDAVVPTTPVLSSSSWEASLRTIGTYAAVETFLGCFSKLHRPSQLERHSSYHVFKDGIKPMWEDERNARGGKWTITFRQRHPALVDRSWLWLVLGLIGEELDGDDEVCGAVCSVKPRGDRIALWLRDRSDPESVNRIGRKLVALLELGKEPGLMVEFSSHSGREDRQEGVFSIANPVQQARTPTVTTFSAAAAGLPEAPRFASASPSTRASPASPDAKSFRQSASPGPDAAAQFGRLSGQAGAAGGAGLFGRSPGSGGAGFGALGQSLGLGLGIGLTTSPSVSPNPNDTKRKDTNAFSWRANRSASPTRLTPGTASESPRSRSGSPFKTS